MRRHTWIGLCLGLLLVVGAGGILLTDDVDDRCLSWLSVEGATETAPAEKTIAFVDLTTGQKRVFEDALEDDTMVCIPPDVDDSVFARSYQYVRYQNTSYGVAVAVV